MTDMPAKNTSVNVKDMEHICYCEILNNGTENKLKYEQYLVEHYLNKLKYSEYLNTTWKEEKYLNV